MSKIIKSKETVLAGNRVELYRELACEEEVHEAGARPDSEEDRELQRIYDDVRQKASRSAAKILEDAYARRDKIVNTAEEDVKRIRRKAQEEGLRQGRLDAEERVRDILAEMNQTLGQIREDTMQNHQKLMEDVVTLGLIMTEKILDKRIKEDETDMLELAEKAVASEKDKKNIVLHVCAQMTKLAERLDKELEDVRERYQSTVKVKADGAETGTCRVETEDGITDASVFVQLDNLREQLKELEAI